MSTTLNFLITLYPVLVTSSIIKTNNFLQNDDDIDAIVFCTNLTVKHLFNPDHRVVVIPSSSDEFASEIIKILMVNDGVLISDRPIDLPEERMLSYVIIENDNFTNSRRSLVVKNPTLRYLQYLFVTKSEERNVSLFAKELWNVGFRDIVFLMFNGANNGAIVWPILQGREIILKSLGYCKLSGNNVDEIRPFYLDMHRFCPETGCVFTYGGITGPTVNFWRKEDQQRRKRKISYATVGEMLVTYFGNNYNISINTSVGRDYNWTIGAEKLINADVDVMSALVPEDLSVLDGVEIICWYMFREMLFAGRVRFESLDNDLMKLFMPYHYIVWLCIIGMMIMYVALVYALRRLSSKGLVKERLEFMQVCAITLGQGLTFPVKFGLRLVLFIWMVFSLYLNITYTSTFTSSLSKSESEVMLKSLRELRASGQPFGGPAIGRTYLKHSVDAIEHDLYKRYKIMQPEEIFQHIFTSDTIALLQRFTVERLNWQERMNRSLRIYTLPSPIVKFPVFLFTRKGYFYRNPLRKIVTRYRETGLMKKWSTGVFLLNENKDITLNRSTDEILTLRHLRVLFNLIFLCQGISCFSLLIEYMYVNIVRRKEER